MKQKGKLVTAFALGIVTSFLVSLMVVPGFAATVAKTITVYTGITLYYDGVKVNPKDAEGNPVEPFLYNGTTYLPVRAVSNLFDEDINWDGSTKSVYIGDMPGMKTYLGVDIKPYDEFCFNDDPIFTMDGKTYSHGFELGGKNMSGTGAYAIWNLNGQYDSLEFDMGHTDWYLGYTKNVLIYLDGTLSQTIQLNAEEMVRHVKVPLNGAMQLKIVIDDKGFIGFANAELN